MKPKRYSQNPIQVRIHNVQEDTMNKIMNTKVWLIIIAFMHTILGILMPMLEYGNIDNLGIFLYFLVLSMHLFYVIIFTENQTQDRLGVILCFPMVIWFVISSIMKLEMFGFPIASMPSALIPIFFWTMPVISGIYNWNSDQNK